MNNPNPATLYDPRLIDLAVWGIRNNLVNNLPWLNTAYGVVDQIPNTNKVLEPMIFTGGLSNNGYISMMPDSHLGNYCWFDLEDPQEVQIPKAGPPHNYKSKVGLIFWFDFRKIWSTQEQQLERNTRSVLSMVLTALQKPTITVRGIRVLNHAFKPKNIFKEYKIDGIELMRPFGAFRINMELSYKEITCSQIGLDAGEILAWSTGEGEVYETPNEEIYEQ